MGAMALIVLGVAPSPPAQAIDLSKPLDTSKGLYIRKDGTRLYKNTKRTGTRVYTYRRRDGVLVRTFVAANGKKSYTYSRAPRQAPIRRTRR